MKTQRIKPTRRRKSAAGFTITEVALALIIFTMMTVLFAAVFPMATRGAQYGGNYTQAAMISQHKMDQLRSAGFGRMSLKGLTQLAIVDTAQPSGYPVQVTGGTSYSFTTADGLVNDGVTKGYFPPGSQGIVTVCDYAALHPSSGIAANTLDYVTITLTWTGGGVSNGSYTTSAIIANVS